MYIGGKRDCLVAEVRSRTKSKVKGSMEYILGVSVDNRILTRFQ